MKLLPKRKVESGQVGSDNTATTISYVTNIDTGAAEETVEDVTITKVYSEVHSANLRNSNDAAKTTGALAYTKIKEMKLGANLAECEIKFTLTGTEAFWHYGKIYKNGVAIGTERKVASASTTFSEDFAGFLKDDLIQIYSMIDAGGDDAEVKDMRFYYDSADTFTVTKLKGETLTTPLAITEAARGAISVVNQDP